MEISVFIAKIFGPLFLVVGLSMIFNRDFFQKVMEDYPKNAALMYVTALFPLVTGIVILIVHNVWVAGWPVLITIFGWGGVVKGVWLLGFPNTVGKFAQAYTSNKMLMTIHGLVAVGFGAFLSYVSYFA